MVLVRFTESTGACWSADSRSWCGPGRWAGASGSVRKYILSAEDLRAVRWEGARLGNALAPSVTRAGGTAAVAWGLPLAVGSPALPWGLSVQRKRGKMLGTVQAMKLSARWAEAWRWVDECPRWLTLGGGAGFCFGASLLLSRLPPWAFTVGTLGLASLCGWLFLSGKPVVTLTWRPSPSEALPPKPAVPAEPVVSPRPEPSPGLVQPARPPRRASELLEMVELSGGEFWMGRPQDEDGHYPALRRHRVRVGGFAMAKYPVTQGQYTEVMGENPSYFQEPAEDGEVRAGPPVEQVSWFGRPVEQVSWFDAVRFCNRLSEREGLTPSYRIQEPREGREAQPIVEWDRAADGYRLPTEAEWEYACRAGTETTYSFGDDESQLGDHAWFGSNSEQRTHTVGKKKPNGWGLHDLHGNVWEWCWDWHDSYEVTNDSDNGVTRTDPVGPPSGGWRVLRGGAFDSGPWFLRAADRDWFRPELQGRSLGFRCVRGSVRQP